jgi:transcriptional regulator with XRE-family HTH domain
MTLTEYLQAKNISAAEFGRRIGAGSRMTVTRYCRGERMPPPETMARIVEVTEGAVQPNDFYSLPAADDAQVPSAPYDSSNCDVADAALETLALADSIAADEQDAAA